MSELTRIELKPPCDLSDAAMEHALSLLPLSDVYVLRVAPGNYYPAIHIKRDLDLFANTTLLIMLADYAVDEWEVVAGDACVGSMGV